MGYTIWNLGINKIRGVKGEVSGMEQAMQSAETIDPPILKGMRTFLAIVACNPHWVKTRK
jgi:hypothetical protein